MNCTKCGAPVSEGTKRCDQCGFPIKPAQKKENVIAGIVGALIGALLGAGCIILISQLGYIASVSGLVLAICTLKGYELLAGKLSGKGIAISIVLMLVTPYLADRIDWAILIMQEWADYGVTFGEAFAIFPELLKDGTVEMGVYMKNLLMIYGFALIGAFSVVRNSLKK
jgi:hypothetical protein